MIIVGKPALHGRAVLRKITKTLLVSSIVFTVLAFIVLNLLLSPEKDILIYAGILTATGLLGYLGVVINKSYITYKQYKAGVEAEKSVFRRLKSLKPEAIINGASFPGVGDCDHLVIDGSFFVIETKSGRGKVSSSTGKIYINGKIMPRDPLAQIERQSRILYETFGIKPHKIICITGSSNDLWIGDTLVTNIEGLKALKSSYKQFPLEPFKKEEIIRFFRKNS